MYGRLPTMSGLAIVSALLAGIVVAPDFAAQARPAHIDDAPTTAPMAVAVPAEARTEQPAAAPLATTPNPPERQARSRVPVGCDRLVSVLARSSASNQLGRCLT